MSLKDLAETPVMISFEGASDDLVHVSGCPGEDEYNCTKSLPGPIDLGGIFLVSGPTGSLKVTAIYDGCWSFAVGQVDEDVPLPTWPMLIRQSEERTYSAELIITAPKGTFVKRLAP